MWRKRIRWRTGDIKTASSGAAHPGPSLTIRLMRVSAVVATGDFRMSVPADECLGRRFGRCPIQ